MQPDRRPSGGHLGSGQELPRTCAALLGACGVAYALLALLGLVRFTASWPSSAAAEPAIPSSVWESDFPPMTLEVSPHKKLRSEQASAAVSVLSSAAVGTSGGENYDGGNAASTVAVGDGEWIDRSGYRYNESTALYLAHITSVSYCQEEHIRNWSCQPCVLVPPLKGVRVVEDSSHTFQGVVGYSGRYDAIVIAFRGSMDVTNWLDNLTFLKKRAYAKFPAVMVHRGFYWVYHSVASQVILLLEKLRKQHPHASLLVAGHSLGGAVAAICAFELQYLEGITVRSLHTFGMPRVGNVDFSSLLHNTSMEVYRLTHFKDVVPHLPPTWTGFEHTTQEIFYDEFSANYRNCSQTDGEDASCSNDCSPFRCTSIVDHLTYLNITMSHLTC